MGTPPGLLGRGSRVGWAKARCSIARVATMATLLCFLLRLDSSHSGAAPSISALYHLDELRISFGAVKLLPIITLPGYRYRPFQRIGPT